MPAGLVRPDGIETLTPRSVRRSSSSRRLRQRPPDEVVRWRRAPGRRLRRARPDRDRRDEADLARARAADSADAGMTPWFEAVAPSSPTWAGRSRSTNSRARFPAGPRDTPRRPCAGVRLMLDTEDTIPAPSKPDWGAAHGGRRSALAFAATRRRGRCCVRRAARNAERVTKSPGSVWGALRPCHGSDRILVDLFADL